VHVFDPDVFEDPTLDDLYDYVEDVAICRLDAEDVDAATADLDAERVAADRQHVEAGPAPWSVRRRRPGQDPAPTPRPLDRLTPLGPDGP